MASNQNLRTATLAGGCFWCTEAIFQRLKGVESVIPGYTGGDKDAPSYEEVSGGGTGHAEAIQVTFDPNIIPYTTLVDIFFATHDPTTLNKQGNDSGTQYRSAIFYHDDEQKRIATEKKEELEKSGKYDEIVTQIVPYVKFYSAEEYHENYYETHRSAPYCMFVIDPKVRKLMEHFKKEVKDEYK